MSLLLLAELERNRNKWIEDKKTVVEWLVSDGDDYTHEATLTFPVAPRDRWGAEKQLCRFVSILTDRCYRKRAGEIKIAALLEGQYSNKQLHYHCALRCPKHMSLGYFSYRIDTVWKDCVRNESARVCIKRYTDCGWLSYGNKEFTRHHTDVVSEHTNLVR